MLDTQKLIEYNRRALAIVEVHPLDYHQREDFRAVIDERSEAERMERNEKSSS
jgi:hypothetical protein